MLILIVLSAVILWRIYDAIKSLPQTENISLWWHGISFLFMLLLSAFVYYHFYGISIQGWKQALVTAVVSWWLCDFIFNIINKQKLLYAGDGKGSRLERILYPISLKIKLSLDLTLFFLKLIVTLGTVLLIFNT